MSILLCVGCLALVSSLHLRWHLSAAGTAHLNILRRSPHGDEVAVEGGLPTEVRQRVGGGPVDVAAIRREALPVAFRRNGYPWRDIGCHQRAQPAGAAFVLHDHLITSCDATRLSIQRVQFDGGQTLFGA